MVPSLYLWMSVACVLHYIKERAGLSTEKKNAPAVSGPAKRGILKTEQRRRIHGEKRCRPAPGHPGRRGGHPAADGAAGGLGGVPAAGAGGLRPGGDGGRRGVQRPDRRLRRRVRGGGLFAGPARPPVRGPVGRGAAGGRAVGGRAAAAA